MKKMYDEHSTGLEWDEEEKETQAWVAGCIDVDKQRKEDKRKGSYKY